MDRQPKNSICLKNISSLFQTLDNLLKSGFGPVGRNTLITTATGQVLITNVGSYILQCLNIDFPVCQLVTKSISRFQDYSGDGSKTFMLYLTGIFSYLNSNVGSIDDQRALLASACQLIHCSLLRDVILPTIHENCIIVNYCENRSSTVKMMTDIVYTYLCGKYPAMTCSHLAEILVEFVSSELEDFCCLPAAIENCISNFNMLCVEGEGMLPTSTVIIKGFILQKCFLFFNPTLSIVSPAKFVILQLSIEKQDKSPVVPSVFEALNSATLNSALDWKTHQYSCLTNWLMKHKVDVVFSHEKIGDTLNGICTAAGISTVQYVDKDELLHIMTTFAVNSVENVSDLLHADSKLIVAQAEFCDAIIIGNKQFVHLGPPVMNKCKTDSRSHCKDFDTSSMAKQLLVYGMSAGACRQVFLDLKNSVKVLRAWLEGGQYLELENLTAGLLGSTRFAVHICGGGTFEMALRRALQKHLKEAYRIPEQEKKLHNVFYSALCSAVTEVPLRLLQNSYNPFHTSVALIERLAGDRVTVIGVNGRTGKKLHSSSRTIEPLATKMRVLSCVLELSAQILRLDCVIGVKKLI